MVELPAGQHEDEVLARAAQRGLAVEALGAYRGGGRRQHGPALVVGYRTPPEHAFTGAVARLCAVLSDPAPVRRGGLMPDSTNGR